MVDNQKLKLRLLNLNCYATEESGYDDVYLMLNGKKIWPRKKRQRSVPIGTTPLNVEIDDLVPGTKLEIEIWDYDVISEDDNMGYIPFFIDKPGGPYTTDMVADPEEAKTARYNIEWEIDYSNPD
ncbi:MAG TPA: hypothetical protein VI583_01850 [Cyclobacteriaceae bacterium]|nr:hypothetical protein [Cyclobacteriaceae bacterium]